jgi:hypothetical protein
MKKIDVILLWLGVWWLVSAILCARSEMSQEMRDLRRQKQKEPKPTTPPDHYGPRMPNWDECMASPSTFIVTFVVAVIGLLQVAIFVVLLWPNWVIRWILNGRLIKR